MYMIFFLTTLHGLTEGGMISFVGQLYQKKLGVDAAQAAYFLSSHAAGFLVGRSLLSWITAHWKISELVILSACATGGTLFFAATIISSSYLWGLVFMGLAGVFVSGNGPSINSYLGMRFAHQAKTAFSLMSGISYIGGAGGPYLVGYLGSQYGLEKSMWIDPLFSLSLAAVALLWFLRDKSGRSWKATQARG
jgi:fucose permease